MTALRYIGPHTLALEPLRRIAVALGPLCDQLTFIGGAIAPLLLQQPAINAIRATVDVDAVTRSASYHELARQHRALHAAGFREATNIERARTGVAHAHRWIAPSGDALDLVPIGDHPAGITARWDHYVVTSAEQCDLRLAEQSAPIVIRYASAPAFLALKWAAYHDRGHDDPLMSHDIEDIVAVLASHRDARAFTERVPTDVRNYLAACAQALLALPDPDEIVHAHLRVFGNDAHSVVQRVQNQLRTLATIH